jgi:FMN-dependent oxidoreductase (nitrilotriacetate monooxygenase family)
MAGKPFHLGWFLQGSSAQAWGEPWTGHIGTEWMVPDLFMDMARSLERACFDYILLEDSSYVGESYGASRDIYLRNAIAVPRQDPSVVAALMTQVTSRLGIVPTFSTFAYPPYLLARLVASLDQVSRGRIGWNMVTGSSDVAARNFGLDGLPEHDLRYDMADEYMDVVNGLWGSWEPGAIVADGESGVFIDPERVHAIDYAGQYYRSHGPLNSGPCPQGRPVIAQAGGSPRGRQFASKHADTIVASVKGAAGMKAYRDDLPRSRHDQAAVPGGAHHRRDRGGRGGAQSPQGRVGGAADGHAAGAFQQDHQHRFRRDGPRCPDRRAHHQRASAEPGRVQAQGRQSNAAPDHVGL